MPDTNPPLDDQGPKRLGDFELLREIGRGGMGIVYEARQVSLNRRVALKILPPGLGLTGQAVQRFEREAQAAAKLHHTNIVPVHAIGEEDGTHYYAMELIEGQPLSEVLKDLSGSGSNRLMDATVTMMAGGGSQADPAPDPGQSSPNLGSSGVTSLSDSSSGNRKWFDVVAKLISEVADALEYAHGRGVIHRDIKPANLMLSDAGKLCITDFGLARVAQEPGMTVSGSLMGTPAYMSPEQIASGRMKLDHRTDVYSLGAVLYEMLTHRRPFPGESREEILGGILTKEPRPPRRCNPRIPVDLETICQKAMEKDPDRRYATAGELAEDLRQYLGHGLIKARRAGIAKRTWKLVRRHPVATTVVLAVLIVVAASIVAWQAGGRAETAQRLVADARLALREGTYREGLQLIDRAIGLDPDFIEARLVRARLLIMNYRMYQAADEARLVLRTDPQNYKAHTILATLALYPPKIEVFPDFMASFENYHLNSIDPEPHLRVVEANAPQSAEAHYLRALSTRNTRQRIELLDRALDLNPGDQLASLARMIALGDLQDHELVLAEADRLIATRPKSAQGWRMKADAYRQQADFENATAAIERAMEVDDRDPRNFLQRSAILRDKGEKDEALSDMNRSIELDPTHGVLYGRRADLLVKMGRLEEAIADAQKSLELNPDDLQVYDLLHMSCASLQQREGMCAFLDELRSRADSLVNVQAKAAATATIALTYYPHDLDRALVAIERAVEIDPSSPLQLILRGLIRRQRGDAEGAEADCEAAARKDLDTPFELLWRGYNMVVVCYDNGSALADFDRVIALAPKWHYGYLMRSFAHDNLRHRNKALIDVNMAIELAPYFSNPYILRAGLYLDQGRFEEALADGKKSIELDPYNSSGWQIYGYILFRQGHSEEALTKLDRALELRPGYADAHADRGQILAHLGRCNEAAADFHKAEETQLVPWSSLGMAQMHLSFFYYSCRDHYDLPAALRHAQKVSDALPGDKRVQEVLALGLLRNGNYTEAKRIYLEMFAENPDRTPWFPLAMSLWHLGEKAEARSFYDRSVTWMDERLPDDPVFAGMQQEAAELLGIQSPGR